MTAWPLLLLLLLRRHFCVYYIIDDGKSVKNIQGILHFNNEFQIGSIVQLYLISKICMYVCILYILKLTKQ